MKKYIIMQETKRVESIEAQSIELRDGCLLFFGADGLLLKLFNRDTWRTCEAADDAQPHGV